MIWETDFDTRAPPLSRIYRTTFEEIDKEHPGQTIQTRAGMGSSFKDIMKIRPKTTLLFSGLFAILLLGFSLMIYFSNASHGNRNISNDSPAGDHQDQPALRRQK